MDDRWTKERTTYIPKRSDEEQMPYGLIIILLIDSVAHSVGEERCLFGETNPFGGCPMKGEEMSMRK